MAPVNVHVERAEPLIDTSRSGRKSARTYGFFLDTPQRQALFEELATSQAAVVDLATGAARDVGRPAMFDQLSASPDGRFCSHRGSSGPSRLSSRPGNFLTRLKRSTSRTTRPASSHGCRWTARATVLPAGPRRPPVAITGGRTGRHPLSTSKRSTAAIRPLPRSFAIAS